MRKNQIIAGTLCAFMILLSANVFAQVTANASKTTACAGTSITLYGSGAASYTWDHGVTDNVAFTINATTTFHVTGAGNSGTDSITITVNPEPGDNAGRDTAVCASRTVKIGATATAGHTYSWSPATNLSSTTVSNPTYTANSPSETFTLTETITATGCSASNTVLITAGSIMVPRYLKIPQFCSGGSVTFSGGAGYSTYRWSPATGLNSSTVGAPTASPTVSTSYTVIVTNAFGCTSSGTVNVPIFPAPSATVGSNQSFCGGGSAVIGSSSISGDTYSWSPSAHLSSSTVSNPTASPTVTTTYTLTETITSTGCTASNKVIVGLPVAAVGANKSICAGGSATIGAVSAVGSTYSWSPSSGLSSSTVSNPTANPTVTTTYTLTETVTAGGCSAANSVIVSVNTLPVVIAYASNNPVCAGSSTTLTGGGASSYVWNNGVADGVAFVPLSTKTYSVTGTGANGCTANDFVMVTVNTLPNVVANASAATICAGSNITLTGSGATSYVWSNGVTDNVVFAPSSGGAYNVTGTDANGCTGIDSIIIIVNALPTVVANASGNPVCAGGSTTLTGSGAVSYIWDNGVTDGVALAPLSTTTYHVTGTDASGCTAADSITIPVNSSVPYIAISSGTNVCNGNTATLTVVSHPVGYAVSLNGSNQYFESDNLSEFFQNTNSFTIEIMFNATSAGDIVDEIGQSTPNDGWHDTQIEIASDGTLTGRVWGVSSFTLGQVTMGTWNHVILRYNDTTQVTDGFVNGVASPQTVPGARQAPYTYNYNQYWAVGCADGTNLGDGGYFNGQVREMRIWNAAVSNGQVASQWDTTVAVNSANLVSYYRMDEGSGSVLNDASAHGDKGTMVNNPTWINYGQPFDTYNSFSWSQGGTANSISITNSGTYTVNVTGGGGCSGSPSVTINLYSPVSTASASANPVCPGSGTTLQGNNGTDSYTWDQGISNGQTIYPTTPATYHVTATDVNGCSAYDSINISISISAPTSFSSTVGGVAANVIFSGGCGTSFIIRYSTDSTNWGNPAIASPNGSPALTGLQPNTTYYTQAAGINGNDTTGWSSIYSFTTQNNLTGLWAQTGAPGFSNTLPDYFNMGMDATRQIPYAMYSDDGNYDDVVVQKFVNGNWQILPDANLYSSYSYYQPLPAAMTVDTAGAPYILGWDAGYSGPYSVKKFDGSNWNYIGAPTSIPAWPGSASMVIDKNNNPYLVYEDAQLHVMNFDGTNWNYVGDNSLISGSIGTTSLAFDSQNNPVIAFQDNSVGSSASVMKFDGSNWNFVGPEGITSNYVLYTSLVIDNDTLFLAFLDGNTNTISVLKYDGANWVSVGNPTNASGSYVNLVISKQHNKYVGFSDYNDNNMATVLKFDGANWNPLGPADFSPSNSQLNSLVVSNSGMVYMGFQDYANNDYVSVMQYQDVLTPSPAPAITSNPADTTVCQGTGFSFSVVTNDGTATYEWESSLDGIQWHQILGGGVFQGTDSANLTVGSSLSGFNGLIFRCIVSNQNGSDTSSSATLTVNALPAVTANASSSTVCTGNNVTLTGSGTATSYTWDNGVTDGQSFTPSTTTTYHVTGTNGNGCSATDSITITLDTLPIVTANASVTTACAGTNVTLTGSGTANSYTWDNSVADGIPFTPSSTATYHVTGTNSNGCTANDSVTVAIDTAIVIAQTQSPSVCTGSLLYFSARGNAVSYSWDNGISNNNGNFVDSTTTYHLTGMDANGCSATDSITVIANPLPHVYGNSTSNPVCSGSSVTLYGSGDPVVSYTWTGGIIDGQSFVPVSGGLYYVTGIDSNGCQNQGYVGLGYDSVPVVHAVASATTICSGNSITLGINTNAALASVSWDNGVTGGVPFVPSSTATYYLTGTDGYGCSGTDSIQVTVKTSPSVTAHASKTNICYGDTVTLTATGTDTIVWDNGVVDGVAFAPSATTTYHASVSNTNGCTFMDSVTVTVNKINLVTSGNDTICTGSYVYIAAGGATNYSWDNNAENNNEVNPAVTTTYHVTATDGNGCSAYDSVTIKVNQLPNVVGNSTANPVCAGSSVTLYGSGDPVVSYTWTGGITDGQSFVPTSTGLYYVTGTDSNGCQAQGWVALGYDSVPPISAVASDTSVCSGNSVTLNITTNAYLASVTWNNNVTNGVPFIPSTAATYNVIGTDGYGCSRIDSIIITVNSLPTVAANSTATIICAGSSITLTGSGNATSYTWDNGVTDGVAFADTATTTFHVTGTNINGCTATDSITVNVNPAPIVHANPSDTSLCAGQHIVLYGSGNSVSGYTWDNGVFDGQDLFPLSTTYHVTGTASNGCSATDSVTIIVKDTPTVTATASANYFCAGGSVALTSGGNAQSYSWNNNITDGVAFVDTATQTYTVTGTAANGCTSSASVAVVVNNKLPLEGPGDITASTTGTSCSAIVNYAAAIYGSNILVNGGAEEGFTGWTIDENGGYGWDDTPYNTGPHSGNGVFSTSYGWDVMEQTIDLVNNGYSTAYLGTSPAISVGDWYTASDCCSPTDNYFFTAEVRDSNNNVIASFNFGTENNPIECTQGWQQVSHTFSGYPAGARYVRIVHGGKDNEYWAGWYGTSMDDATVRVALPDTITYDINPGSTFNIGTTPVHAMAANECGTDTVAFNVTVTSSPAAINANGTTNLCPGGSVTLDAGVGYASYAWSTGDTTETITVDTTSNYSVTVTGMGGCTSTIAQQVTMNPLPTVQANATQTTVCTGTDITLWGSGSAWFYNWDNNVADGWDFNAYTTTTYHVTGIDGNGCSAMDSITITVDTLPVVHANASSTSICKRNNLTLTGSGAQTYVWDNNETDGVAFVPSTSATYSVVGTDGNGCTATDSVAVTVQNLPSVTASTSAYILCANDSVTLTGKGAITYRWNNSVINGVPFKATATNGYEVIGTDAHGCTGSAGILIEVKKLPTLAIKSSATTICRGGTITLTASGATTYSWNNNVVNGVPFIEPVTNTYTVTGTGFNGCSNKDSITVVANNLPKVTANSSLQSVCKDGLVTLTGGGAKTYTWNNNVINGVAFEPSATNTYQVKGIDVNGCTAIANVTVTVDTLPVIVANASANPVCQGTNVTLSAAGADSISWSSSIVNGVPFSASHSQTYTVIGTNSNGCTGSTNIALTVNTLPSVIANTSANPVCQGGDVTLSGSGAVSYTWDNNVTNGVAFTPSSTATYHVNGTDANGCSASDSITISLNTIPSVPVAIAGSNVSSGQFTANWNTSTNSTNYFLDVASDSTFNSFISGYDNLSVGNVTYYTVTNLAGQNTYYYRVRANNTCGTTINSNRIAVTTTPSGCNGVIGGNAMPAYSLVCDSVTQQLTVSGAAGGTLQWQVSSDNLNWNDIQGATNTTYITNLITQNVYYRCVTLSSACFDISSTTAVIKVSATPALTITNVTSSSVMVSWTPYVPGQYNVSWSGAAGTGAATGVTNNSYLISGLISNADLTVSVTPTSLNCNGVNTGTASAHTLCGKPVITSLAAANAPLHAFTVQWTAVSGASTYRVYYNNLASSNWSYADTTGTSKTIVTPAGGESFAVYVVADNCPAKGMFGEGSAQQYVTTNPLTACSVAPTVSATSSCPNQITVNLTGGSGKYIVRLKRVSPTQSSINSYSVNTSTVNITVGTAYAGTVWEVYASSVCSGLLSPASSMAFVTVQAACPVVTNVVISNPTCEGFTASWNPNDCGGSGVTDYQLMIKPASSLNYSIYNVSKSDNYDVVNWLKSSGSYDVAVRTVSCNGALSASSTTVIASVPSCRQDETVPGPASSGSDNKDESVVIYPNPTSEQFFVDLGRTDMTEATVKIELISQLGQVIQTDITTVTNGHMNQLVNTGNLAAGIYYVRTTVGSNTYMNKIMIAR